MKDRVTEYKEISCKDFRPDCDFTARAKTENELFDKCEEHACNAHGKCGTSASGRDKMRSHIRDVWG